MKDLKIDELNIENDNSIIEKKEIKTNKNSISDKETEYEISKKVLKKKLKSTKSFKEKKQNKIKAIQEKLDDAQKELEKYNEKENIEISLLQKKINNNLKSILGNQVLQLLQNKNTEIQAAFENEIYKTLNARDKKKFVENFDFINGNIKELAEQNKQECIEEHRNRKSETQTILNPEQQEEFYKIILDEHFRKKGKIIYGRTQTELPCIHITEANIKIHIDPIIADKLVETYGATYLSSIRNNYEKKIL